MKAQAKKKTNLMIGAMLVVAVLATAFWMTLLSPAREEASKLSAQIQSLESSLSQHRAEAETAALAKQAFAGDYSHLVVLGKAVPGDAETASLLVQVNHVADEAHVRFESLTLNGSGESSEEAPPSTTGEPISATEAAASLLPLGASIGPAGLAVMPYSLTFTGDFFQIADFVEGLDNLVKTSNANVAVDGRLITVNGFTLQPEDGTTELQATFSVTTFVTPPGQGLTGGATLTSPEAGGSTLTSTTTGTTP